jgi:hypothetical protein
VNKVKQVTRRETPYEGGDNFMEWHKEKLNSTLRDADYATPIWRCETDFDRAVDYIVWGAVWAILLGCLYLLATWFERAM